MIAAKAGTARSHYEAMAYASRIEAATPHDLVLVLYEELLLSLSILARSLRLGDRARASHQFSRTTSILHALCAGLDPEKGGSLAIALSDVYHSALHELRRARETHDAARIDLLSDAFADMTANWRKLAA